MTREELLKIAKPILFNTEMVQALLEGRKTVTRRLVKPKHKGASGIKIRSGYVYDVIPIDFIDGQTHTTEYQRAPYSTGDYLYVRETWCDHTYEIGVPILYKADMPMKMNWEEEEITLRAKYFMWKPSIHMPKEAARLFLKVTDVRAGRLQDMTLEDAHKEGVDIRTHAIADGERLNPNSDFSLERFETLWNSTIKKADLHKYGWEANPWVWVIEFERIEV